MPKYRPEIVNRGISCTLVKYPMQKHGIVVHTNSEHLHRARVQFIAEPTTKCTDHCLTMCAVFRRRRHIVGSYSPEQCDEAGVECMGGARSICTGMVVANVLIY